jgi:hypothetical protein
MNAGRWRRAPRTPGPGVLAEVDFTGHLEIAYSSTPTVIWDWPEFAKGPAEYVRAHHDEIRQLPAPAQELLIEKINRFAAARSAEMPKGGPKAAAWMVMEAASEAARALTVGLRASMAERGL